MADGEKWQESDGVQPVADAFSGLEDEGEPGGIGHQPVPVVALLDEPAGPVKPHLVDGVEALAEVAPGQPCAAPGVEAPWEAADLYQPPAAPDTLAPVGPVIPGQAPAAPDTEAPAASPGQASPVQQESTDPGQAPAINASTGNAQEKSRPFLRFVTISSWVISCVLLGVVIAMVFDRGIFHDLWERMNQLWSDPSLAEPRHQPKPEPKPKGDSTATSAVARRAEPARSGAREPIWRRVGRTGGVESCSTADAVRYLSLISGDKKSQPLVDTLFGATVEHGCVRFITAQHRRKLYLAPQSDGDEGEDRSACLAKLGPKEVLVVLRYGGEQISVVYPKGPKKKERGAEPDGKGGATDALARSMVKALKKRPAFKDVEVGDAVADSWPVLTRLAACHPGNEAVGVSVPSRGRHTGLVLASVLEHLAVRTGARVQLPRTLNERHVSVRKLFKRGLVDIKGFAPTVQIRIAYATTKNFTRRRHYSRNECYLRKKPAMALGRVSEYLAHRGLGLRALDCYRPNKVQWGLWKHSPMPGFVARPSGKGSAHNHGLAIDLTLVDSRGKELDMPTEFDDFTRKANQGHRRGLRRWQIENRETLKDAMTSRRFKIMKTEWWHYRYPGRYGRRPLDIPF